MVPFQAWLPDIATFQTNVATDARNVIPHSSGYQPFQAFNSVTDALTARAQGAVSYKAQSSGGIHNFAGDATKLYKLGSTGLAWDDVTRTSGGAYATPSDGKWNFLQFGDLALAFNGADATQSYTLGSSTDFALAAGSPPIASYGGVVRDFAILARVSTQQNRIKWSAIDSATDWVTSATTLSDSQDFPEGGTITGFVGGEYGIVFQEKAIQRMSFEGPPTVFRFDKLANNIGCPIGGTIAAHENLIFFRAEEGFHMLRGGSEIVPIGEEKVDEWFEDNFNASYDYRCTAVVDPLRHLYLLSFPSMASADGTPDTIMVYDWRLGRWSYAKVTVEMIYAGMIQASYTIDTMDDVSATIDGLEYPVDSRFWSGSGQLYLAGFDTTHKQGFFSGSTLEAIVETGDEQPIQGRLSLLRGLRPMVEGSMVTPTISIGYRKTLSDSIAYTAPTPVNSTGFCPTRANGRYLRAKMTIPAASSWTFARGVDDLKISPMGRR
jgi:hypothetical protein